MKTEINITVQTMIKPLLHFNWRMVSLPIITHLWKLGQEMLD